MIIDIFVRRCPECASENTVPAILPRVVNIHPGELLIQL